MSCIFFIDESGQDHGEAPYEVRGGIIVDMSKLWNFTKAVKKLEELCFGSNSMRPKLELKGQKILKKRIFKFAFSEKPLENSLRLKNTIEFLNLGAKNPRRIQFVAYGQSCLLFVRELFKLIRRYNVIICATIIPPVEKLDSSEIPDSFLRKDFICLWENYFYILSNKNTNGVLILDETEKLGDLQFIENMDCYFKRTERGKRLGKNIIPIPFFIKSDMNYGIQVADICIYCINWGYRKCDGLTKPIREELKEFENLIAENLYGQSCSDRPCKSLTYIPNPFSFDKKKQLKFENHN